MKIDFTNKTVLITGASRGIGREIAKEFFRLGANIISTSTKPIKIRIPKNKRNRWKHIIVDFADEIALKDFFQELSNIKRIDILINNAGINEINKFTEVKKNDFLKINKVNLSTPFLISQKIAQKMIRNKSGKIINVSSIFGVISKKKRASYSTSKAGLIGLTKAMALDLASHNILVNSISPGFVSTELTKRILKRNEKNELRKNVPLSRFAESSEIVNLVLYLSSKYNTYLTGQNIVIDGGYTIQ